MLKRRSAFETLVTLSELNTRPILADSLYPAQSTTYMVSIIIVTYNGRAYLYPNLTSVTSQLGAESEIIVVDNASTDGGDAFIQHAFPGVRLQKNPVNIGFAAACNQGAALARGEFLVFLNQDTRVAPGWLQALVEPMNSDDRVGLTTSKVLLMSDPSRHHLAGQNLHFTGLVFGRGYLDPASKWVEPANVNAVSGASFAIRRQLWEELGGFDETFFMYYEETDLSWRARLAGYSCLYAPDSVVYHDYRPGNFDRGRLYYSSRNRQLMLLKSWNWPTLLILSPGILLAEIVEWVIAAYHGRSGLRAKIQALWWVLSHIREIHGSHLETQRHRKTSDSLILEGLAPRLSSRNMTGDRIGRSLIRGCNVMLILNYRLAKTLCELLGL